jgi:hypothetical protein
MSAVTLDVSVQTVLVPVHPEMSGKMVVPFALMVQVAAVVQSSASAVMLDVIVQSAPTVHSEAKVAGELEAKTVHVVLSPVQSWAATMVFAVTVQTVPAPSQFSWLGPATVVPVLPVAEQVVPSPLQPETSASVLAS